MHSNRPTYRTFWGISSFEILAWFRRGLFYSFLSIYLRHFLGLSVTETTLFATLPMIVNILFQTFVWGKVSDKYQLRRTLIIIGEISAGIGTVALWYAHRLTDNLFLSGYIIIIGLTLIEVFWSMSNVSWSALISDLYRLEDRNRIQGRLASLGGVGRIAGVWSGGLLYDGFGLQFAGWGFYEGALFFVAAGAMLISTIPMLFVPEGGIGKPNTTGMNQTGVDTRVSPTIFMVFLAAMAFINFGRNSIAIIQVQYLVLESGFAVSSKVVGYIVNSHSAAMIITGFISGWLGKRLGNGNALILGAAVSVAGLILIAFADTLSLVYVSNVLRGVSEVIILASSYVYASILIPPENRAKLFGMFNATFFLSWGIAGTLVAGPIIDMMIASGAPEVLSYRVSFMAASAMTSVGILIMTRLVFYTRKKRLMIG